MFIVGTTHTFEQLAHTINAGFTRRDLSHLQQFELADGRLIGYPDDSYEPDVVSHDHAKLKVAREVKPGEEFEYVFDLGDDWRRCTVADTKIDPLETYGIVPLAPVAIFGGDRSPTNTAATQSPTPRTPPESRHRRGPTTVRHLSPARPGAQIIGFA